MDRVLEKVRARGIKSLDVKELFEQFATVRLIGWRKPISSERFLQTDLRLR